MRYLGILISILFLTACGNAKTQDSSAYSVSRGALQASIVSVSDTDSSSDSFVDYEKVDKQLAAISREMAQPNVLKSDILRGWYLGAESDKKYGTPENWIFIEEGENSKWISSNAILEEEVQDDRRLCKSTAGTFITSCLDTTDEQCTYVEESYCGCISGSKWKEAQGCILVSNRGGYLAINAQELKQGWYYALPNEKKLNTPASWIWHEDGRESTWRAS